MARSLFLFALLSVCFIFPNQSWAQYYDASSEEDSGAVTSDDVLRESATTVANVIAARVGSITSRLVSRSRVGGPRINAPAPSSGLANKVHGRQSDSKNPFGPFAASLAGGAVSINSTMSRGSVGRMSLTADLTHDEPRGRNTNNITQTAANDDAGGETAYSGLGTWTNLTWTHFSSDATGADFNADQYLALAGADMTGSYLGLSLGDDLLLGAAASFEVGDIDTKFNGGELQSLGAGVTPYVAYIVNEYFYLSGIAGVTYVQSDVDFLEAGNRESGDFSTLRWYTGASANLNYYVDMWEFGGTLGYLYARDSADSYTESDGDFVNARTTNLGQASLAARAGYNFDNVLVYGIGSYEYENVTGSKDPSQVTLSLGADYFSTDRLTLSAEASHVLTRDNFDSTGISVNLRYDW
ncbi:autotransporter outer membrane beta-barrel domain-containing protein [Hwanghaeella grinnelliae]|uniref:Autotransporter outer membrane beta-barrel domain-containing protein n=1 Tax=Hwanghaeella grinnelliae TaxID=2500179 RepID=A0A3S2Y2X9_9PROT|nr:autotransporter outer membrane beta-barrel domain-containing protein [Hwanghaeella grinnelliae]RVU36465.1 autotransporter outer membrane beta-barrel domain-containing protein [Hwanghaeella grinnelliae]